MSKTERLFNLIALLLSTPRALRVSEIRAKFPAYSAQSDEAFRRMFERDKNEIQDLGFTIEREVVDALTDEIGYRIHRKLALLDDPGLTADEMAALSLAAQAWRSDSAAGMLGVLKLSAGASVDTVAPAGWMVPRVALDENVTRLVDAVSRRKRVQFAYRTGGSGKARLRTIEPHGLFYRGTWYVTGFDKDRAGVRHFKLSRVRGTVKVSPGRDSDFEASRTDPIEVPRAPWEGNAETTARVAFSPEAVWWVERRTRAIRVAERANGWVELALPVSDIESLAGWVAGFGDQALVLDPAELRAAVIGRLRALGDEGGL